MQKKVNDIGRDIRRKTAWTNVILAFEVTLSVLPYFVVAALVGRIMGGTISTNDILLSGLIIIIGLALKAYLYRLFIWKSHETAYQILADIRIRMIGHLKQLPLRFFQQRKTGDLANIIHHDVEQVELFLAHALPEIMTATFIPLAALAIITTMEWRLGLALVAPVPLIFGLRKVFERLWTNIFRRYSESTKAMSEDLLEYIAAIPVIKAFAREEWKTTQVLERMRNYIHWVKGIMVSLALPMGLINLLLEGGLVVMIVVGSLGLEQGLIDMRQFVLALSLGGLFTSSFVKQATFQHYRVIYNQALTRIGSVMREPLPRIVDPTPEVRPGDIELRDVGFSYNGGGETLSRIHLTVKSHSIQALVGLSGSGKSTLAGLIMGFWPPDEGGIMIGGREISHMDPESLSNLVSLVQQDVFLFNLSLKDNIRIGKPDATLEEIIEAARKARIHEAIMKLPEGYDTPAGEAGLRFSGGEKQRLSIARLLLKNPPIIILDEATAGIDPVNERLIQEAIARLSVDKTIIMIAHRMSAIESVDRIAVLDHGRIIAEGRHRELMETCPRYAEMVRRQKKVDAWQIREERS